MRVGSTLKPGQPGTKKLVAKYGDRLIAVRYRDDAGSHRRITTAEVVEDSVFWDANKPRSEPDALAVRIDWAEEKLREALFAEASGAQWDRARKWWILDYHFAKKHKLLGRAIPTFRSHL